MIIALHPLAGAAERVSRAEEHLADLRPRLPDLPQQIENAVGAQFNSEPPHAFELIVPVLVPASMRIAILIGEFCYNLRSALDYLVFELAKLDTGVQQNGTQFPICDTKKEFDGKTKKWLKGLSLPHLEEIEALQPYRGCGWTKALRDFSNPDKHREFVELKSALRVVAYLSHEREFSSLARPVRRIRHPVGGEVELKIDIEAVSIPILETLEMIKVNVAETLSAFRREFT